MLVEAGNQGNQRWVELGNLGNLPWVEPGILGNKGVEPGSPWDRLGFVEEGRRVHRGWVIGWVERGVVVERREGLALEDNWACSQ